MTSTALGRAVGLFVTRRAAVFLALLAQSRGFNLAGVAELNGLFPLLDLLLIQAGRQQSHAPLSPELAGPTIYVIDVAVGDKIPRKGGPGIAHSRHLRYQQDRSRAVEGASL